MTGNENKTVAIAFTYHKRIFPKSWNEGIIKGYAESLDSSQMERSKKLLNIALCKYPNAVISKNLKKVYFLKSLHFYDVNYGGTYYQDTLYVVNSGSRNGYTDQFVEKTIHHEFSSILYQKHSEFFNETAWKKYHLSNFSYGSGGAAEIKSGKSSEEFSPTLNDKGFLTEYSMSSLENDINEIAQNLFSPKPGFWHVVYRYPKVRHKVNIVIQFYHKIDPIFTMGYFMQYENKIECN